MDNVNVMKDLMEQVVNFVHQDIMAKIVKIIVMNVVVEFAIQQTEIVTVSKDLQEMLVENVQKDFMVRIVNMFVTTVLMDVEFAIN